MKVIWRRPGEDWTVAHGKAYKNEAHLQELLAESPVLIPFEDVSDDIPTPRVMIREFGLPGSGSSDIVGIDEQGGITIIECKLAANPEIKRKVIGQILEYAAFLWQKPYSFLDQRANGRLGMSLCDAMKKALDEEGLQDWNETDFVTAVSNTLLSGEFRLVIAVDSLNDELRKTIQYLSEGPSSLQLFVLEVSLFRSDDGEVLIPRLHGSPVAPPPKPGDTLWGPERYFDDAKSRGLSESEIDTLQHLLEFSEAEASRLFWGRGREMGSFTFHHLLDGQNCSFYSVYSDGSFTINFGWLKERVGIDRLKSFSADLHDIPSFGSMVVRDDFSNWPRLKIAVAFPNLEALENFKVAVLAFRDALGEPT